MLTQIRFDIRKKFHWIFRPLFKRSSPITFRR